MNRGPNALTSIVCCLGLAAIGVGQGSIASPAGAKGQEGEEAGYVFGRYAEARFQFAEGDLRGTARVFTDLLYRRDYRDHTPSTAMGRRWSNVSLDLADCDYAQIGPAWNFNASNTPTRVFTGPVEWPTATGFPISRPDLWGGISGKLAFAFSSPYPFAGTKDLLLDFDFSGGVLANSASWAFTDARFYYLDAENATLGPRVGASRNVPPSGSCADSAWPQLPPGAVSSIAAEVYPDNDPNAGYRGMLRLYHETINTAPIAPVLQVLGLTPLPGGIDVGAHCSWLNVTTPWLMIPGFTDSQGASGRSLGSGEYLVPFDQAIFGGLPVWTQAAWTDSTTQGLGLTRAATVTIPHTKPFGMVLRKQVVYHYAKSVIVAFGPTTSYDANPFLLLRHQ